MMSPDDALKIAEHLLLTHTGKPITDVQQLIIRDSLLGKTYEAMEGYSPQHIKNEGKVLWDLLSEALGERVSKTNFKSAFEKRLKSTSIVLKQPMPSNYDEQTWVERKDIASDLLPKLQEKTRLLWITGISGIGKTSLGEYLASQEWKQNPSFQWIYLEILDRQNPDFASVAAELLTRLGTIDLDPSERNNPDQLARQLLQKLQTHSYWIQIDSLERLLDPEQSTQFIDPYWAKFFQRYLTSSDSTSRLVLTSQVFPGELIEFGDRYPNTWLDIQLNGLLQTEQQLEFFAKRGVHLETESQAILNRIGNIYKGHPLVLKVIAEDIVSEFKGDVSSYWQMYQSEFEQVARELKTTRLDEIEYNEALDRKVRDRIRRSVEQLPQDAFDLICRSSVFRRPVPKTFWLAMIGDRSPQQQKHAYQILSDRTFIEKEKALIRQHNLIRDVVYSLLKADESIWKKSEQKAADLWLHAYTPTSNEEIVRSYLESFEHYCVIENWKAAYRFPYFLVKKRYELHRQLLIWGYPREAIQIHSQLISISRKVGSKKQEANNLEYLGNAYSEIGQYKQALECYQEQFHIASKIGDSEGRNSAIGNQGRVFYCLGQYEKAINLCEKYREISQKSGIFQGEGAVLGYLGDICRIKGQYKEAISFHDKQLEIFRMIDDREGEGSALCNLGLAYHGLGQHDEAIDILHQSLKVSQETGARRSEGCVLGNIGFINLSLERYSAALKNFDVVLELFRRIGAQSEEAETLKHLAEVHQALGNPEKAKQYCQDALAIATDLELPLQEEYKALQRKLENSKEAIIS